MDKDFSAVIAPYVQNIFNVIFNPLIQVLFFLAFLYFGFGIVKMLAGAGDEAKRSEGKKHIFWGIVGMAIMVSVWGIVAIIGATIGDIVQ